MFFPHNNQITFAAAVPTVGGFIVYSNFIITFALVNNIEEVE